MESHRQGEGRVGGGRGGGVRHGGFPLTFPHLLTPLGVAQRGGGRTSARFETFQIYLGWRKFNLKWRLRYNGSLRYSATLPHHPSPPQLISTLPPPPFPTYFSFIHTVPCVSACRHLSKYKMPQLARELLKRIPWRGILSIKEKTGRSFNIIRQIVDLCSTFYVFRKRIFTIEKSETDVSFQYI